MRKNTGKPLCFIKWHKALLKEDQQEGHGEVKRPPEALRQLYGIYRSSFQEQND